MHISCGILFNHESPRRGLTFVTRKVTHGVARIHKGKQECVYLGNLDSKRDWGHAQDYVQAMWMMLQQDQPDNYVVATGETRTVRELVEKAFGVLDHKITWEGKGVDEVGKDEKGRIVVRIDPQYYRPTEVEFLLGDCSKIKKALGWRPKVTFDEMVEEMIKHDVENADKIVHW